MFFRDTVEYDYYLRPVLNLGRCHFKGGKGGGESTTERSIPEQTAEEKALQDRLMGYTTHAQDMSNEALNAAARAYGNVFTPNWTDLYDSFSDTNERNMSRYNSKVDSALGDYGSQVGAYKSGMDSALGRYKGDIMSALDKYTGNEGRYLGQYEGNENKYLGDYQANEGKYLGDYQGALGEAKASYDAAQGKRSPLWDDLVNGVLPSAYATNRQAALNADLRGTIGNAVNNYANSGVLNSSVTNKALGDISQNAADTLHKAYQSDLALEASLLNQDKANAREAYDVAAGNAGSIYGAQTGSNKNVYGAQTGSNANVYGAQTGSNRNVFGNESNVAGNIYGNTASNLGSVMGAQTQLANSRLGSASDWIRNALNTNKANISGAITSQGASYEPISNYLNYASKLYAPGENLFNTMYGGRMGTGSTTTRTDNGNAGMWSAAGTLGAAAIMCFVGNTLVTTPEGYKYISDIVPGDTVLSVHDGEVVPKMVRKVSGPCEKEVIDVVFENGQVWHTTRGQRYWGGGHFHFAEGGTKLAEVYDGEPTRVLEVVYSGRTDKVYDIALEGFKGENVFFANDVAAEGFGE